VKPDAEVEQGITSRSELDADTGVVDGDLAAVEDDALDVVAQEGALCGRRCSRTWLSRRKACPSAGGVSCRASCAR
jgi:hypothetical protein